MPLSDVYAASSLTGQYHEESGQPNQDAFVFKEYKFGTVMAVADGLGSKPLSHVGSAAVCEAVCEAARIWSRKDGAPVELLIRLIHSLWELRIAPYAKSECGTTCLFAVMFRGGRLVCGQLGDGIIAVGTETEFRVVADKEDDFANLTLSMHAVRGIHEWKYTEEDMGERPFGLLLATDGVSEDLIRDKRRDFLLHLQGLIREKPGVRERNAAIRQLLANWSAKHSYDDKTLMVFHRGANNDHFQR